MDYGSFISPETLSGFGADEHILLALSGGADSVLLFHLLLEGGYSFSVAHLNHLIRGEEACRDEEFCRSLAARHSIPFYSERVDVPLEAKRSGEGLEEAARRIRYAFLLRIMRENSIRLLATAHNATDNAETLIFSLSRGCGPSGACGIAPVRSLDFATVIRPLISMSKPQILALCAERGYSFVTDSTNTDIAYTRNRIRKKIIPELGAINPSAVSAISSFTEAQRLDEDFLSSLVGDALCRMDGVLRASALLPLHPALSIRILQAAAYEHGARPERRHLLCALRALCGGDFALTLPGSVILRRRGDVLSFEADTREGARISYPEYSETPLVLGENKLSWGFGVIVCSEAKKSVRQIYNLSTTNALNIDRINRIGAPLTVTPRREGDIFLYHGHHRRLRRLISEQLSELSRRERADLPVIRCGGEIVFVPLIGAADGYADTDGDMLLLQYSPTRLS